VTGEGPNVLVVVSHDTGRHISPYGVDTVQTPNFERLAAGSVRFTNAFACSPQCSPARAALFSGCYPHAAGVMGNVGVEHGWRFSDSARHAGRIFADAGYQTWMLGLQHESYLPERLGFDDVDLGYSIIDAAGHLEAHLEAADPARPFYCQIGCPETHRPWDRFGTPPDDDRGVWVPPYLEQGPLTRADFAQFQGWIHRLDTGLGAILDLLDRRGLTDNTILVATADHGIAVPRAKCTLLDSGTGVFLFMRCPQRGWREGATCADLVSHVDVLPTLAAACAIGGECQFQGQSFLGALEGRDDYTPREAVYLEKTFFQVYDPMRGVRTDRYLYLKNFELCRWSEVGLDCRGSGTVRELGDRWTGGHPADELYDLDDDPWAYENRAGDPAFAEIETGLKQRLAAWMAETDDPLLRGPVQSPYHRREVDDLLRAGGVR